jgi:hypothetical protein
LDQKRQTREQQHYFCAKIATSKRILANSNSQGRRMNQIVDEREKCACPSQLCYFIFQNLIKFDYYQKSEKQWELYMTIEKFHTYIPSILFSVIECRVFLFFFVC